MFKIPLFIGLINIIFQIVYSIFGAYTTVQLETNNIVWIFYVFRPEYLFISGAVSFSMIITSVVFIIILLKKRKKLFCFYNMLSIFINVEFLIFYYRFMFLQ